MTMCIILAAGKGTRLLPHTNNRPKSLVELNGRALLHYQLDVLNAVGIHDITIVTGYKHEQIKAVGYPTIYNAKYDTTNMVESLILSLDAIENESSDILICYSDIVYQRCNLEKLLKMTSEVTVMTDDSWLNLWSIRNENPILDAETLKFSNHNLIKEIGKKPSSLSDIESQFMGVIKIAGHKIKEFKQFYKNLDKYKDYDGKDFEEMFMTSLLQELINFGWEVRATRVDGGWLEVDTVSDLDKYHELHATGNLHYFWKHDV
jgi:L-glutamine-phosphate cytidylyltransferase